MIRTKTSKTGSSWPISWLLTANSLPDSVLNTGRRAHARNKARVAPAIVTMTDSVRNWATRYFRGDPSTFLMPTSLARLADRAVDRFMKLIQAINRMNKAMAEKMYT